MVEHKWNEMINRAVDGDLTPSEEKELARFVAENQEAGHLYREAKRLSDTLNKIEKVEPPTQMKTRIMSRIKQHSPAPKHETSETWIQSIKALVVPRVIFPFASGLAAGAALLALFAIQPGSDTILNNEAISGAIGIVEQIPEGRVVSRQAIELPDVKGFVETVREQNSVWLVVETETDGAGTITIMIDETDLATAGYLSARHGKPFVASSNRIGLTIEGLDRYVLAFEDLSSSNSEITLEIRSTGTQRLRVPTGD